MIEYNTKQFRFATNYAKHLGWKIFPVHNAHPETGVCSCHGEKCSANGKHPRTQNGFKAATTDEATIERWWGRQWKGEANVGIATGPESGIWVLDVDLGSGGDVSLEDLQDKHGKLPDTVTAITGSGGTHYYFKYPQGRKVKTSVKFLAGLDSRGWGGYVVAPPSRHKCGGTYEWEESSLPVKTPLADAPEWLLALVCEKPLERKAREEAANRPRNLSGEPVSGTGRTVPVLADPFTPADDPTVVRALAYLAACGPAVEGSGGDVHTFKAAGHLLAFGLTENQVFEVMNGSWNNSCSPSWDEEGLMLKIHSAAVNGTPRAPKPERSPSASPTPTVPKFPTTINPEELEEDPEVAYFEPRTFVPPAEELPKAVRMLMDYYATKLERQPTIHDLMAAIYSVSAVVGKRVRFTNRAAAYYCNFFMALLAGSGQNKSGLAGLVADTVGKVTPVFEQSSTTAPAFLARYGTVIQRSGDEDVYRKIKEATDKHAVNMNGTSLVVDEFRAFISEFIPENESVKYGQLFCRLTENRMVDTDTVTRGTRVLGDPCINLLGFSQCDPWNSEMRSAAYQMGGLSGRIIPVNAEQIVLKGVQRRDTTQEQAVAALQEVRNFVEANADLAKRIGVTFGEGTDPLGETKSQFSKLPYVSFFQKGYPAGWELLENKILVQAAKIAALLAVCETAEDSQTDPFGHAKQVDAVDAGWCLKFAFMLVGYCHLSNNYHEVKMSAMQETLDRIVQTIRRAGKDWTKATQRQISRVFSMKGNEVEGYLKLLLDDGTLEACKPPKGKVKVYYRLSRSVKELA